MTVRDAIESDIPALLDLASQDANAAHWSVEHYARLLDSGALRLVQQDTEIAGFYAARHLTANEWELDNILVAPEHRRKGIADALLRDLLSRADTIHLEVRASNAPARRLYEKHGFRHTGTRRRYYSDPVEDAILYTRVTPVHLE